MGKGDEGRGGSGAEGGYCRLEFSGYRVDDCGLLVAVGFCECLFWGFWYKRDG